MNVVHNRSGVLWQTSRTGSGLQPSSRFPTRARSMFSTLMSSRRFAPIFWCQFFSAFNDNFLKNALVFLILYKVGGADAEALVTLAGAIFIAPFFLLSGL